MSAGAVVVIQVRLDGPTEDAVRYAAQQMSVQVNRVKQRNDCCQLYGTRVIDTAEKPS